MKLTDEDRKKISLSIEEAEKKTSGEIVPMIVSASDDYIEAHFRLALILSFGLGLLCYVAFPHWESPLSYFYVQAFGVLLGFGLAYFPSVKRFFIGKKERWEEVHQRAIQTFFYHDLHSTKERTGILIMVSFLERRVEILADSGINAKVAKGTWDQIVKELIDTIHEDHLVEGICQAIQQCGKILSEQFPRREGEDNQLRNEVITDAENKKRDPV